MSKNLKSIARKVNIVFESKLELIYEKTKSLLVLILRTENILHPGGGNEGLGHVGWADIFDENNPITNAQTNQLNKKLNFFWICLVCCCFVCCLFCCINWSVPGDNKTGPGLWAAMFYSGALVGLLFPLSIWKNTLKKRDISVRKLQVYFIRRKKSSCINKL